MLFRSLMVDPIKGCAEINLYDPILLPTLQCTLQCMRHAQKCITGTQAFPISKLGGWKHTTALNKSSEVNLHQGRLFMRRLGIPKNIPLSGTKLTLGLRVGFISSHLTVDKLLIVNPRAITGPPKMSLLLEAKSMPALIIKPRLILAAHTDDLGWNKTFNQQQQMLIQNLNRIVSRPDVTSG